MSAAISSAFDRVSVAQARGPRLAKLALAALGVVYGDIGTSPLYAVRECFGAHGVPVDDSNVLGVMSLIVWSLVVVVVLKYLVFLLRTDNEGEGGIMALFALVTKGARNTSAANGVVPLVLLGIFGAALLYADGIITPAISVTSAVEGLGVANPAFETLTVPISVAILIALFRVQRWGTGRVGALFGVVTAIWFVALAWFGATWILKEPRVLAALSPHYAVGFFVHNGWAGFVLLGSVVLVVTGGEALYADMGHFGRRAIRVAWFSLVFPALLLNYLGQGAYLLSAGAEAGHPFYSLVPAPLLYPMVGLATAATVVASQALISGAFSLTHQASQLGYFPRLAIVHTSGKERGQIYIPEVNELMMFGCIAMVVGFGSSANLAAAYGTAVTGTMTITSVLFFAVARERMGTRRAAALLVLFLVFDLAFLGANALKIAHGGWFPLAIGASLFAVMTTWYRGRRALGAYVLALARPLDDFVAELRRTKPQRVDGAAVFMTASPDVAPPVLLHHLRHTKVLHELVILLVVRTESAPELSASARVEVRDLGEGIHHVTACYGFMQQPNVVEILEAARQKGLPLELDETSFYLGRESLLTTGTAKLARWRKRLFTYLARNASPFWQHFGIPPDRVVEIGIQVQL